VKGVTKLELPLTAPKYLRRARDGLLLTVSKIYFSEDNRFEVNMQYLQRFILLLYLCHLCAINKNMGNVKFCRYMELIHLLFCTTYLLIKIA
jgi:hypothetical protein